MKIATIVVIFKNSSDDLIRLKKSLLVNCLEEKDIFFSDNSMENLGYGGGINRILMQSNIFEKYDYFFILNPDVILHKNCIVFLLKNFEENSKVGIAGPKILDENGKTWSVGGELDMKRYSGGLITAERDIFTSVDFVSGTAMLIRKEVFEKIGLFKEDYFLYYEDVDFCLRAKKAGFQLAINPKAEITHFASTSTGKNSPLMQYYMARNHLLVVERYAPLYVKFYELLRLPKTIYQARNKKYEILGIRDYFLRRFGKSGYWS